MVTVIKVDISSTADTLAILVYLQYLVSHYISLMIIQHTIHNTRELLIVLSSSCINTYIFLVNIDSCNIVSMVNQYGKPMVHVM